MGRRRPRLPQRLCQPRQLPAPTTTITIATVMPDTTSTPTPSGASVSGIAEIPLKTVRPPARRGRHPRLSCRRATPRRSSRRPTSSRERGRLPEDGDSITVQYVLATYSSRKVIQSSWTSNPFTFTLGRAR